MSGHSKWSQIKRQKAAGDVKKGQAFTRATREILLAAREGGASPEANFRLRLAIEKARAIGMPKDNIQRAIERASGRAEGQTLEEILYEGYGAGGVSVMVAAITDNRNRTASEVRSVFTKFGAKLGESGSVQWMFEQKGQLDVDTNGKDADELSLRAIDAGAEDVVVNVGTATVTIYTAPGEVEHVKRELERQGERVISAEVSMRPNQTVRVEGPAADKVLRLVDALEELDDVQRVHANFDIPDEILAKVS
jgi:YebC/PmpR family DNA-binding regulatory protein